MMSSASELSSVNSKIETMLGNLDLLKKDFADFAKEVEERMQKTKNDFSKELDAKLEKVYERH